MYHSRSFRKCIRRKSYASKIPLEKYREALEEIGFEGDAKKIYDLFKKLAEKTKSKKK